MGMFARITMFSMVLAAGPAALAQPGGEPLDWPSLEPPVLTGHVQLTSREDFTRAGEAYFCPRDEWIIFQATPVPPPGAEPDPFYSMYVARLTHGPDGHVDGITEPILISPPGSANTCGWFHPHEPGVVLFGSTVVQPATDQRSGFQVGDRRYQWLFPQETNIVTRAIPQIRGEASGRRALRSGGPIDGFWLRPDLDRPVPMFKRPDYDAEASWSPCGRYVLYAAVRSPRVAGLADADIWIYDTRADLHIPIITAEGYDGGPFFSPCGTRICYRSDRRLDNHLQLFVSELAFDDDGNLIGLEREHQVTDNEHVNWAPFWHPSGRFLVYASSEVGHWNYEVFAVEVDLDKAPQDLARARITRADGADILPVFNSDGTLMMWTAQRGPLAAGEQRPSSQLWIARFDPASLFGEGSADR
jgi:TolB protein